MQHAANQPANGASCCWSSKKNNPLFFFLAGTPCSVVEITGETQISGRYALMYNEGDEGQLAAKNGQPVWAYEVAMLAVFLAPACLLSHCTPWLAGP